MQFLRFVVALFFISIHGAIAAAMNRQGCPQDLCYEGLCREGGDMEACPGNAKCMNIGTPGQLGCCAPCGVGPHGMPTGWITSIVSTHPVPTFPRSIKSIPIPTDRSTSANATITLTNVPSFVKSIESLLTDRSPSANATHTHHGKEPTHTFFTSIALTNVPFISAPPTYRFTNLPSIVPPGPSSFIQSIQSLLSDRSTSTPAPAHTYTYTTEGHGYGGGLGPDGCPTGLEFLGCAGTSTSKDASPAATDIPTHFTTIFTPTHRGTSTTKDASPADIHTIITK